MDYTKLYASFLLKNFKVEKPISVVFDCSNGATGPVLNNLFSSSLNIRAKIINSKPDGNFPAHGPNPFKSGALNQLKKEVLKNKADLGIIFDGDGDRVIFVDDKAREVAPDLAALALALNFKGPVLLTPLSGFLMREKMEKAGRKIFESRVGHTFIKKTMREKEITFAAEVSGHYYFKNFFYNDSGIFAAIKILNFISGLKSSGASFSARIDSYPKYFKIPETNFPVKNKKAAITELEKFFKNQARKISHLDGVKMEFEGQDGAWWFSARESNTEDLLR